MTTSLKKTPFSAAQQFGSGCLGFDQDYCRPWGCKRVVSFLTPQDAVFPSATHTHTAQLPYSVHASEMYAAVT